MKKDIVVWWVLFALMFFYIIANAVELETDKFNNSTLRNLARKGDPVFLFQEPCFLPKVSAMMAAEISKHTDKLRLRGRFKNASWYAQKSKQHVAGCWVNTNYGVYTAYLDGESFFFPHSYFAPFDGVLPGAI